jgi:hypothetical protein
MPVEPVTPGEPVEPVKLVAPVEPPAYVEPVKPVEYVQPVQPVQPDPRVEPVDPAAPAAPPARAWSLYRTSQSVYLALSIVETLIVIRVILRLLGANPDAGFTSLIYGLTFPFDAPFLGVFPNAAASGSVLELSSLLALVVYPLLAWVIVRVAHVVAQRRTPVDA